MRIFSSRPKKYAHLGKTLLLGANLLIIGSLTASAQVLSRAQDFNAGTAPVLPPVNSSPATTTLSFGVVSVGNAAAYGYYTTTGGVGTGAYGVEDANNSATPNTLVLDFAPQTFQTNSTSNQITLQVGSRGVGGFDGTNQVQVGISINGAAPVTVLTLNGPNSGGPVFNPGTGGTATATYPTPVVAAMTAAAPIGNITINLPSTFSARTVVGLRVTIGAAKKAINLIDNVTISSASPLPVELTRFSATPQANNVNLAWATASEKNSAYFEVQRSAAGEAYATIGKVAAQGSSTIAHDYAFVDVQPLAGTSYYRLHQVDVDGRDAYSPVVAVRGKGLADATIYPNPSAQAVLLPAATGPLRYRLSNALGQMLLDGTAEGGQQLDISRLPAGTFFLELRDGSHRRTQRLVRE